MFNFAQTQKDMAEETLSDSEKDMLMQTSEELRQSQNYTKAHLINLLKAAGLRRVESHS